MDMDTLRNRLDEIASEMLEDDSVDLYTAEECGLDRRAAWQELWVSESFICCTEADDRGLQYYGGFEYVDKAYRKEVGSFVFYFKGEEDDGRVADHISRALSSVNGEYSDDLDAE
jgi:hypothetical protein